MTNPTTEPTRAQLLARIRDLEGDVVHWQSNHANEVYRSRVLRDRPDIPLERTRAWEHMVELEERVAAMTSQLTMTEAMLRYWQDVGERSQRGWHTQDQRPGVSADYLCCVMQEVHGLQLPRTMGAHWTGTQWQTSMRDSTPITVVAWHVIPALPPELNTMVVGLIDRSIAESQGLTPAR